MALREKDARYVADLAHLELTEDELKKFIPQLDSILKYVEKLNELDTTAVEPMAQVTHTAGENPAIRMVRAIRLPISRFTPTFGTTAILLS